MASEVSGQARITSTQMMAIMERICDTIEEQKDYLSELDGALGDGDHGVNMAKCFREVRRKLPESQGKDIGTLIRNVGMVVMNSVGGAMGALYGSFFLRMAQQAAGKNEVDLHDLVSMFEAGEQGVRAIGKAEVGDKTLLDTLVPAVSALAEADAAGKSLPVALAAMERAAREGMESTTNLVARVGRASRLGERTLGHQDAGATSCYFILRAFAGTGAAAS